MTPHNPYPERTAKPTEPKSVTNELLAGGVEALRKIEEAIMKSGNEALKKKWKDGVSRYGSHETYLKERFLPQAGALDHKEVAVAVTSLEGMASSPESINKLLKMAPAFEGGVDAVLRGNARMAVNLGRPDNVISGPGTGVAPPSAQQPSRGSARPTDQAHNQDGGTTNVRSGEQSPNPRSRSELPPEMKNRGGIEEGATVRPKRPSQTTGRGNGNPTREAPVVPPTANDQPSLSAPKPREPQPQKASPNAGPENVGKGKNVGKGRWAALGQAAWETLEGIVKKDPEKISRGVSFAVITAGVDFASKGIKGVVRRIAPAYAVMDTVFNAGEAAVTGDKREAGERILQGAGGAVGGIGGGMLFSSGAVALGASSGGWIVATAATGGAALVGAAVGAGVYYGNKAIDQAFFGSEDERFKPKADKSTMRGLAGRDYVKAIMKKPEDWNDPDKLNRLSLELEKEKDRQKAIKQENESFLPRAGQALTSPEALQKSQAASSEIQILDAARTEANQRIQEIAQEKKMAVKRERLNEAIGNLYIATFNQSAATEGIKPTFRYRTRPISG
jgi:hypothetical protein